jgi:hypothetical protein
LEWKSTAKHERVASGMAKGKKRLNHMLCEKCRKRKATISYTTPDGPADEPMLNICEPCLGEISSSAVAAIKKVKAGEKLSGGWTSYNPLDPK